MDRFFVVFIVSTMYFQYASANNVTNPAMLPTSIIPENYEISLSPRLSNLRFTGHVVITGIADRNVGSIVLHSDGLDITSGLVYDDGSEININRVNCAEDRCELELEERLQAERTYSVELEFNGFIRNYHGIYTDKYVDSNGTEHAMVMTEFQPVNARKAFPCFDEPAMKAQFVLRIARPQNMTVISNMPLNHTTEPDPDEDNYVWDVFEKTPPMSTYQIAFVISDYVNITDSKTNTSVWGPAEKMNAAEHTLQVGVTVLLACQDYFGVEYLFPKLDHVPLPSQMFSAMENWGIIMYLMEFFYYEEGISTSEEKLWNTAIIMHEVSHQWFGNLVTLKWWSFTWLSEGFATFFNSLLVDKIEPSWKMMDIFAVLNVQHMLALDFDETSHPLINPVNTSDEISFNFDSISYDKGAAILHMVYHFLTPEIFQKGVNLYLVNNAYSNVDDEDLWVSLEANVNTGLDNLQDIMYNWTYQAGYPMITVHRKTNQSVVLTQVKYDKSFSDKIVSWWIPLTYTTSSELDFNSTETREWFDPQTEAHVLRIDLEEEEWIIFNIRQIGYYRVNYDTQTWQLLIRYLKAEDISKIHPVNRAMLIDDAFSLAQNAELSYDIALNLSTYLYKEMDYVPWVSAIRVFNNLMSKFHGSEEYSLLQKYMLKLIQNVYNSLSFSSKDGDMITKLNRRQIIEFACSLGHRHCETESLKLVYLLMSGVHIELPVDLKATILCTAVRVGHVEAWNFVEKLYATTTDKAQSKPLINALSCSTKADVILRLLEDTIQSGSMIREEHAFLVLHSIGLQRRNSRMLLNFINENIFTLLKKFHSKVPILLSLVSQVKMNEEDEMKVFEIIRILKKEDVMPKINLNDFKENSQWNDRYFNTVSAWLVKTMKEPSSVSSDVDNNNVSISATKLPSDASTSAPELVPETRRNSGDSKTAASIMLLITVSVRFLL